MTTKEPRFVIVNDADRPYPRLVAIEVGAVESEGKEGSGRVRSGLYRYLSPELDHDYRVMEFSEATNLKDFGFEIFHTPQFYLFIRSRDSVARYHHGAPRKWQGEDVFVYFRGVEDEVSGVAEETVQEVVRLCQIHCNTAGITSRGEERFLHLSTFFTRR